MKLTINIFSRKAETFIGLDQADKLRKAAGLPNLSLDRIADFVCGACCTSVTVPEDIARRSGCFRETNQISIKIATGEAPWWRLVPVIDRDEKTGEITQASVRWEFDAPAFLKDWEESGFPDAM